MYQKTVAALSDRVAPYVPLSNDRRETLSQSDAGAVERADDEPERAGGRAGRRGEHGLDLPAVSAVLPVRRSRGGLGSAGGGGAGRQRGTTHADPRPDELERWDGRRSTC